MSPSTADSDQSVLTINFSSKDEIVASLSIAQASGQVRKCDNMPAYIDQKSSINIDFIDNKNEIDQSTPIQVYCGNDLPLPNILLLEETEYDMELRIHNIAVNNELQYLFSNQETLNIKINRFGNEKDHKLYTFYSKGYIGKGFFDVTFRNETISLPFEVRSKKIEYLQDYPKMLEDIADFSSSLLLDSGSPLYRNYSGMYKTRKTRYEDFLLLDYIFGKCNFESMYEYVRNSRYSELKSDTEEIVNGSVSSFNISTIIETMTPDNLIRADSGIFDGKYNPVTVKGTVFSETYDNPENRIVKDLLLTLQTMVYELENSSIKKKSEYISSRLDYMKGVIDRCAGDLWLSDVGMVSYIPYESTILQGRFGYSDLFQMYQMLNVGIAFSQDDVPDLFEGHNKKIYYIYEYWCFTKLYRCLYELSENKPIIEPTLKGKDKTITIRNGKPIVFLIEPNGFEFKVQLYYNREFDQESDKFKSYSVKLRPDFTLIIDYEGRSYIINFDSKYKLKLKKPNDMELDDSKIDSGCWEYDIYKMHTYRDALIKSLGSYVLYPGKNDDSDIWEKYIKPIKPDESDANQKRILPSVGAISLTPGSQNEKQLKNAIEMILDSISNTFGTYYV